MIRLKSDITPFFDKCVEVLNRHIAKALFSLGKKYDDIIRARSGGESWNDHSGNLRSSVGAGVFLKGALVMKTAFAPILNGSRGSTKGRQYIQSLANQYSEAFTLALVAAMDYADEVESIDGKDVLASASIGIEREFQAVIEKAIREAESELQRILDRR